MALASGLHWLSFCDDTVQGQHGEDNIRQVEKQFAEQGQRLRTRPCGVKLAVQLSPGTSWKPELAGHQRHPEKQQRLSNDISESP